ncbi:MAG TPA: hypothetical protein VJ925_02970 [Longimicrobiales bacterium]|nr:hypothetical protein [Longimicrobiales bacterium]
MSATTPVRRFLLLVLLPALATCIGVANMADDARRERREAMLARAGGMLSAAVQTDLAEAWSLLEAEAAPVTAVDTSISAVRRARSGDTVRALGTDEGGPRASVLFPRGDTLVSATAVIRSPVIEAASEVTHLDVALYLQGVRLQPPLTESDPAGEPADLDSDLPPRIDPVPGWTEEEGLWIHPATASLGSASGDLVVALRPTVRSRSSTSLRTQLSAGLLLLLSFGLVVASGAGEAADRAERRKLRGRVLAGVALATLTTAVVSISVALGAERRAVADGARELEIVADLVEARGLANDPAAAGQWAGSPVYAVRDGTVIGPAEAPVPSVVTDIDPPASGRPMAGVDEVRWRAVAAQGGYTVFVDDPVGTPPLLLLALGGTLITLFGSMTVTRASRDASG